MNDDLILKIGSDFRVSWDVENLVSKFSYDLKIGKSPYSDPSGVVHWQTYPANISFARNFTKNFLIEAKEIEHKLAEIQQSVKDNMLGVSNPLVDRFIKEKIHYSRANLIRVSSKDDVGVHVDSTRMMAVNIGLLNSNTHETLVSHNPDTSMFDESKKSSYILNNGDAYLVLVKNPHCVKSLNKNVDVFRYVITYNMLC